MLRKGFKFKICIALVLLFTLIPSVCFAAVIQAKPNSSPSSYCSDPADLRDSMLYAQCAVAVDASSGRVLFSKNADKKIYPASTTKVMTALLAMENLELDKVVTVSKNCLVGESSIYLEEGERITVKDLLYGLLLKSGNDAGVALAEAVSGSVKDFAVLMNERAEELGCVNTQFANPHGLTDQNHYTTADDYAKVVVEAMKNELFMTIIQTKSYTISATGAEGKERTYACKNTNAMLEGGDYEYEYMVGGKTGFTDTAQNAFVGVSQKDDMQVATVVFGSTQKGKWLDTQHLADYAFAAYTPLPLAQIYLESGTTAQVENAADPAQATLALDLANPDDPKLSSMLCSKSEAADIKANFAQYATVTYENTLIAPVQKGKTVAQLHFTYDGMEEIVLDLVAANTVAAVVSTPTALPTQSGSSISQSGVNVVTTDVTISGWSPLYLLVIIPIVLFFILIIWLFAEIRRARRYKRDQARARRTEDVKRRRAQRDYEHLQATPLPHSQRAAQARSNTSRRPQGRHER